MRGADIAEIGFLIDQIRPLLAGKPSYIQGAVIADLLAIWLAGHHVAGDIKQTSELRSEILTQHLKSVADLVNINAAIMGTTKCG